MTDSAAKVEPVSAADYETAMEFLACGRRGAGEEEPAASAATPAHLWWARRGRKPVAAAAVVENPGKTGTLICCRASAPPVEAQALVRVVRAVSIEALYSGMSLVQCMLRPHENANVEVVRDAGFTLLAELVFLRRPLCRSDASAEAQRDGLTWRDRRRYGDDELGAVIAATYEHSMDCPGLAGLRDVSDVIAGHKATGQFRPESWWIVELDGKPAGCMLVNDIPISLTSEVVYLGVTPGFRRRGLARRMLRLAAADAAARGMAWLSLAVDDRNAVAKALYLSEGFRRTDSRLAFLMARSAVDAPSKT